MVGTGIADALAEPAASEDGRPDEDTDEGSVGELPVSAVAVDTGRLGIVFPPPPPAPSLGLGIAAAPPPPPAEGDEGSGPDVELALACFSASLSPPCSSLLPFGSIAAAAPEDIPAPIAAALLFRFFLRWRRKNHVKSRIRATPTTTPTTIPAIAPPLRPESEVESSAVSVSDEVGDVDEVDVADGDGVVVAHVYEPWKTSFSESSSPLPPEFNLSSPEHPAEPVATIFDSPPTVARLSNDNLSTC